MENFTEEQAKNEIVGLILKFSPQDSDIHLLLKNRCTTMTYQEVINLLASSISILQAKHDTTRKNLKRVMLQLDTISQGVLI